MTDKKLLKIIVHWDMEGISADSYLLEMTQEEFDQIKPAHGYYINCVDDRTIAEKAANIVSFMLGDKNPNDLKFANEIGIEEEWIGKFKDAESIEKAIQEPIDGFVACGFAG